MSHDRMLIERNHTRLSVILARIRDFCELNDWPSVNFETSQFSSLLYFEIGQEEDILFPAYRSKTHVNDDIVEHLVKQHSELREVLDELIIAMTREKKVEFEAQFALLNGLIADHNDKEEELLLAMMGHFEPEELEKLGQRMREYVVTAADKRH